MFSPKSQIALFLTLSMVATTICRIPYKNSLKRSTAQLAKTTVDHAHGALCSVAKGVDHLFYPALCTLSGKYFYEAAIAPRLSEAPEVITHFEKNIPGAHTTRNILVYAVVGGLLCSTLNYASNIESVNDFIQSNMPHVSALLQHINTEFSGDFTSPRSQKRSH